MPAVTVYPAQSQETPVNLVDVKFSPDSRPRNKLKQFGGGGISYGQRHRPHLQKLREFEQIAIFDATVSFALFALIDTLLSYLGPIHHPDKEIEDFLRHNIDAMGGSDNHESQLYLSMYKMIHTALWAGFSTTETIYGVDKSTGNLLIEDFATYHPASILVRPNKQGRLTEGDDTWDMHKSGIYQSGGIAGETQLPLWKTIHLTHSSSYGNYYGISLIEPIYKWYLLKEAFIDMMSVALDRFGNPIVAITIPSYQTNQKETDPTTGEERALTTQELLERQIANQSFSGGGNVLILPQLDEKIKPAVQVLTTGNNVGNTFHEAILNADKEIAKGLLVPYGLISTDHSRVSINQKQMELFNRILASVYRQFVGPILSQSFHRLIRYNFNRESTKIAPSFPIKQVSRPEDRVSLMQMVSGLTEQGYFNPSNEKDWRMVREMVDVQDREFTPQDIEFVRSLLVYPRIGDVPGRGQVGKTDPSRDRSTENRKRGKGSGAGRPFGTSAPKGTPSSSDNS